MKNHIPPCLLAMLCVASAPAATFTWDGAGSDTNWSTAANWSPDGAPANDGTAVINFTYSATPGSYASVVDTAFNINQITIGTIPTNSSTPYTISGSTLTFSGSGAGITVTPGVSSTTSVITAISNNIILAANATITLGVSGTNTGRLDLTGNISGNFGITMGSTLGDLRLSGNNTFTGGISATRGNVLFSSDTALGSGTFVSATGNGGHGLVASGGSRTITNSIQLNDGTGALNISGTVTTSGNLILKGTGTSTRNLGVGTSTYGVGNLTINGNVVQDTGNGGTAQSLDIVSSTTNGGTITFNGNANHTGATTLTVSGSSSNTALTVFVNGDFSSSSAFSLTNTGTGTNPSVRLRGTGTVSSVSVGANTILAPGGASARGTLNVMGGVNFDNNSIFQLTLEGGGVSDKISLSGGNVSIGSGVTLALSITGGYSALGGSSYTLATFDATTPNSYGSFSSITLNGSASSLSELQAAGYDLLYAANGIYLQSTNIPEPSAVTLLIGGIFMGYAVCRRRETRRHGDRLSRPTLG